MSMGRWKCVTRGVILFVLLTTCRPAYAVMFCNMDQVGGPRAAAVRSTSARASAKILEGLALTMRIFAEIELDLSGDRHALSRARQLVAEAIRTLNEGKKLLEGIAFDGSVAAEINEQLNRARRNFGSALVIADVVSTDPAALVVQASLEKQERGQALFRLCAEQLEKWRDEKRPLGQVYVAISKGRVPGSGMLLAAAKQLNEVLAVGRLVTAVFMVAGQ